MNYGLFEGRLKSNGNKVKGNLIKVYQRYYIVKVKNITDINNTHCILFSNKTVEEIEVIPESIKYLGDI